MARKLIIAQHNDCSQKKGAAMHTAVKSIQQCSWGVQVHESRTVFPCTPTHAEQRAEAQEKVGQPFTLKRWQMLLCAAQTNTYSTVMHARPRNMR